MTSTQGTNRPTNRPSTIEERAAQAAAREQKLAALHQTLTEQITALASGPQWQAWLTVAARFHTYSLNNTLLILAQRPEATHVAGYRLWQTLGRQVNKGEKGLAILAPVTRTPGTPTGEPAEATDRLPTADTQTDPDSAPATGRSTLVAFRAAYVWDISQTTGDPLPEQPRPQLLAGQAPDGLWDHLAAQCETAGFTVDPATDRRRQRAERLHRLRQADSRRP